MQVGPRSRSIPVVLDRELKLYISEYFDEYRDEYIGKLQCISQTNDWEDRVAFFLDAVDVQSKRNAEKANQVLQLYSEMKDLVASISNSPYGIKVLDTLFSMPVFRRTDFGRTAGLNPQTTHRLITRFKQEGILTTIKAASGSAPETLRFERLYKIINQ